ncbi:mechanosensitive ion channel protein MscS, partial [Francisella tularensis subsp. holarctica]|nr:mechanosensitive ion channel protein MscS [Francisella tularensis subsp. holarctica]
VIKQKLLEILKSHPNIDQNKNLAVSLASGGTNISGKLEGRFGSSGINIQIYAMGNKVFFSDFINVQDEIFINIAK